MKRTLLIAATALALSAPAVPHAHAGQLSYDDVPGHFLDTRHQIDMKFLPDSSEAVARLNYAKIACGATTEISAPLSCMKSHGFVWRSDTAGEIAAREKAKQGERNVAAAHIFGQALIGIANDLNRPQPQPQHCNGFIYRGGDINMNCN